MAYSIEKVAMKKPFYTGATEREVSVHYLIGRKPEYGIKAIVPEDKTAWHCGESSWTDHAGVKRNGCNSFTIGIELSNMGPPEPFTDFQYEATAQLAREIMERHPLITLQRIVGHQDIAPGRKVDPGPLFDWERFRRLVKDGDGPPLKIVLVASNSLIECHPRIENGKTRVDMRAVCDAIQVSLPTGAALAALNPEVVPPGVTRVDLRPLAENNGWEVLTHKLTEENKIYLRKQA